MALSQENRWAARPRLAAALKFAIYTLPFITSLLVARATQSALRSSYPTMHWSVAAVLSIPVAGGVMVLTGRLMRRLLPLALLLKLSLLFPDQIPGRLGVALRAASTKRLLHRMEVGDSDGSSAAENILALVAALGSHDRRTRGHSERVRALTVLLADDMGLTGEDRDKLEWAALLHDLGKLEVPAEILNKNGRPTDHEWAILRQHPGSGPQHAGAIGEWLGDWIHAMDQHHEKFDGSGYPLGLTAGDIALSGRIVAVSDAFEVMTATRSYKKPMTTQAARDELVACAGTHFDPAIVRSFMTISIGDIHRALGPSSWLASIPYIGTVTQGIGATAARTMLGGAVSPAFAATAALLLVAPGAGGQRDQNAATALAFADVDVSAVASQADGEDQLEGSDLVLLRLSPGFSETYLVGMVGGIEALQGEVDVAGDEEVDADEEVDSAPDDAIDDVVLETVDDVLDGVDDVVNTVQVLTGDVLGETLNGVAPIIDGLGVEETVETVAAVEDAVVATVQEVAAPLTSEAPVEDVVEAVTAPIGPPPTVPILETPLFP